jgi:hypothetical protein
MAFSSRPITTNEATAGFRTVFFGVFNTDGTPKEDLSAATALIHENGGSGTASSNNFAHVSNARYSIELTQAEVNKTANTHLLIGPANAAGYNVVCAEAVIVAATVDANVTRVAGQTAAASGTVTFPNAMIASTTNITAATGVTLAAVTHAGATIPTVTTTGTATNVTTVNGIAANAITATAIATGAITSAKFAAGAIDAAAIADNAIDAGAIAANAITSAKIATDAIGSAQLAATATTEIANAVVEAEIDALETYNRSNNTTASITGPTSGATTLTIVTDAAYEPIKSIS